MAGRQADRQEKQEEEEEEERQVSLMS